MLWTLSCPPRETLDLVLDTYMKAVHWFMLLFHEQTFRRRYEDFLAHGIRSKADSNFYKLLLVVCVSGASTLTKIPRQSGGSMWSDSKKSP
jgi:hypothetical protein